MKVALVHDYLNQVGGGERVLDELIKLFPDAPIYTLLYDEAKTLGRYKGKVKKTSFLDFKFARDYHRLFIPLMPLAARSINLGSQYDLIISDSAGFGKGIKYDKKTTKHICYVHTPLRYAWETKTYFGHSWRARLFNTIFKPAFWYVRNFDLKAAQQPDVLIANSQYIADKIKQYYGRDAVVIYPPVDTSKFYFDPNLLTTNDSLPTTHCYLALGRLLHYKRFDLIVDAFNKLGLPLKIVGAGPKEKSLRARATSLKIGLTGFVKDDAELRSLYSGARGFIMANEEDFGLVTAEAQACGTPVIAYRAGGSTEIIEEGNGSAGSPQGTGVFFDEQTPESLVEAITKFDSISSTRLTAGQFDRKYIAERAKRFSVENFRRGIKSVVARCME